MKLFDFVLKCAYANIKHDVMNSYVHLLQKKYPHLDAKHMCSADRDIFVNPDSFRVERSVARMLSHQGVLKSSVKTNIKLYEHMLHLILFLAARSGDGVDMLHKLGGERVYTGKLARSFRLFASNSDSTNLVTDSLAKRFSKNIEDMTNNEVISYYLEKRAIIVGLVWDKRIQKIVDNLSESPVVAPSRGFTWGEYSASVFSSSATHSAIIGETVYQNPCTQHPTGCACKSSESLPMKEGFVVSPDKDSGDAVLVKWNPATIPDGSSTITVESLKNLSTARRLDLT